MKIYKIIFKDKSLKYHNRHCVIIENNYKKLNAALVKLQGGDKIIVPNQNLYK